MSWRWLERHVDVRREHLVLSHDGFDGAVAVVGPPEDMIVPVAFVAPVTSETAKVHDDVRAELDYYLVELGEPDPWAYALYHCRTASNLYSTVHRGFVDGAAD